MDYNGQTFRNCDVDLDGNRFFECHFEAVVFNYNGGPLFLEGCVFAGYHFNLGGYLGRGLEALRLFAHSGGSDHVRALVDSLSSIPPPAAPIPTFTTLSFAVLLSPLCPS